MGIDIDFRDVIGGKEPGSGKQDPVFGADPGLSGIFGGDDDGDKKKKRATDAEILAALGIATFDYDKTDDIDTPLLPRYTEGLWKKFEKRGLSEEDIPEFTSVADLARNASALAHSVAGLGPGKARQEIIEIIGLEEIAEQDRINEAARKRAEELLANFVENRDYEVLLEDIRDLPASLPDEQVDIMKRKTVQMVRDAEVSRLREERAISGIGGVGGGSLAARADRASRDADFMVTRAFNEIKMEQLESQRQDVIQKSLLEAQILGERQDRLLQLEQHLANVTAGGFNITAPMSDMGAFLAAQRTQLQSYDMWRTQSRQQFEASLYGGITSGVGNLLSPGLG